MEQWRNALRIEHIGHSRMAARCETRGRLLGVVVVVLSAIVATSVFSTLESSPSTALKIVAGMLSVAAGVAAALQTFLGFGDLAGKHRDVAAQYGSLRRQLDAVMATSQDLTHPELDRIRARWDELAAMAPLVPQKLHDEALRTVLGQRGQGAPRVPAGVG
jgi:hypothetical protein